MRSILLALVLLFSSSSFADNYVWKAVLNGTVWGTGASPAAACAAVSAQVGQTVSAVKQPNGTFYCKFPDGRGEWVVGRSGTNCPNADDTYNDATGECVPAPNMCASKAGESVSWGLSVTGYLTNGNQSGIGDTGNIDGCQVSISSFTCSPANDGSNVGYCQGIGTFTGEKGNTGTPSLGGPGAGQDPDPPQDTCGTGYSWSGSVCVPNPPHECDPSTGEVCSPSNPDNPGGGDDGGDDGGDGDGDGGSGGGGSGGGSGDGSGGGSGDGSGDGSGGSGGEGGTGDGDGDDGDDDKPTVTGDACGSELKCSGDAIQCAILKKNKEQLCQWNYDATTKQQIESTADGAQYKLGESTVSVGTGFTDGTSASRWLSSSCPSPKRFSAMGKSYQLSWQPVCDFSTSLAPLIVAMAGIFFAVYVGRGLGGQ